MLTKYGAARHIRIPIVKRASSDYAVGADWTPAAGDVKISKDGGAAANVTNLPTAIAMGNTAIWDFHLTATEMEAAEIVITVADSATKVVEDQSIYLETYGHTSAQHAFDLDTATVVASSVATGGITAASFGAGAIDAAAIAAGAIGSSEIADGAITAAKIATDAIDADALSTDAVSAIQANLASQASVDTIDDFLDTEIAAIKAKTDNLPATPASQGDVTAVAAFVDTEVASILAAVDTEVAAIKAKTDNLPASPAATGDIPSAGAVADAVWDEATTGHTTSGTFGEQAKTDIDAILAAVDTELASVLAAVDTEVAAIKAKTDNLPAAPAATGDIPTTAQIADAVWDEVLAELAAVPSASPTARAAVAFLLMALRNKVTTTATQTKVHNDAGTAIATAAVSDNGTVFERGEYA